MLTSIRSRIQALVLSSLVFASIALLSACGGGSSGGNNNGGGSPGAPVIANTQPLAGTINSADSFTFTVSSGGQAPSLGQKLALFPTA
jgi:hypothetical protein